MQQEERRPPARRAESKEVNDLIHEASALAEYWRKLYVRTGHVQYLRTAEVLATLRAAIVDKKITLPADFNSKPPGEIHEETENQNERQTLPP